MRGGGEQPPGPPPGVKLPSVFPAVPCVTPGKPQVWSSLSRLLRGAGLRFEDHLPAETADPGGPARGLPTEGDAGLPGARGPIWVGGVYTMPPRGDRGNGRMNPGAQGPESPAERGDGPVETALGVGPPGFWSRQVTGMDRRGEG